MSAERLSELVSEGAATFDPEGVRFVERLLAAGLDARASQRIEALSRAIGFARDALDRVVDRLAGRGIAVDAAISAARAAGDLRVALRLAKRLESAGTDNRSRSRWALALAARANARGMRLPEHLAGSVEQLMRSRSISEARASELGHALSRELFENAVARTRATLAIARATDTVPSESGPYNRHAIAARVLAELDALSPEYARALVTALDDLAVLDRLPAPLKPKLSGRRKH